MTRAPAPREFEPEFVDALRSIFEEKIVFNTLLGLRVTSVTAERVSGRIEMKPELVGHFAYNRVHGGVISAGLDAMGGLAAMAAIGARHMDEAPDVRILRFGKLGTIDLRVDYLRPATGDHFTLNAEVEARVARGHDANGVPRTGREAPRLRGRRVHRLVGGPGAGREKPTEGEARPRYNHGSCVERG